MASSFKITLTSLTAAVYAGLVISAVAIPFGRSGNFAALARGLANPHVWVPSVLACLVAWGIWKRYAWAWWLGLAACCYQLWRILDALVPGPLRLPGAWTLLVLAVLALFLVLLVQRAVRVGCNR